MKQIFPNNDLIHLAKNGDENAFKELFENNFYKSKFLIKRQFNLSYEDLEDIMQKTSFKVWKNLNSFRGKVSFYNWFYSIFRNEALNFVNKKNKISFYEKNNLNINYVHELYKDSSEIILLDTAQTFLEKKEEIQEYKKIIDDLFTKLSPNHQKIIKLILVDGKTYKEASDILGISIGSIMSRFFYAKKKSQKIISEYSKSNELELKPHFI